MARTKGAFGRDRDRLRKMIKAEFPDYDPLGHMVQVANDPTVDVTVRLQASKEACQYIYPKLKAIEHTGDVNTTMVVNVIKKRFDFQRFID